MNEWLHQHSTRIKQRTYSDYLSRRAGRREEILDETAYLDYDGLHRVVPNRTGRGGDCAGHAKRQLKREFKQENDRIAEHGEKRLVVQRLNSGVDAAGRFGIVIVAISAISV